MGGAVMPHPHMLHWDAAHPGVRWCRCASPRSPSTTTPGPASTCQVAAAAGDGVQLYTSSCQAPGRGRAPGLSPRPARRAAARRRRAAAACPSPAAPRATPAPSPSTAGAAAGTRPGDQDMSSSYYCSVHHRHGQHGMGAGYKQSYLPQVYPMVPPHLHMMAPHHHPHPLKHVQVGAGLLYSL